MPQAHSHTEACLPSTSLRLPILDGASLTQRVQVPNNQVLGLWVIGNIVQVLGTYMIIRYLDP